MRHVTDGELNAYLDGALDHLPFPRGDEVRGHLDACEACRERLEDEKRVRSRAEDLLGLTVPGKQPAPSFEDIRARAEAGESGDRSAQPSARVRGLFRGIPLGWAATVILALGVGWMGGQVWQSMPQDSRGTLDPPSPGLQQASTSDSFDEAGSPSRERQGEVEEASPPGPEEPVESDLPRRAEVLDRSASVPDEIAGLTAVSAMAGADASGAGEELPEEGVNRPAGEPKPEAPVRDRNDDLAVRRSAVALPSSRLALEGAGAPPAEAETILPTEVGVASDQSSMAIPGLAVLSVEWEEWAPGDRALYIRQLLPMGDTLELRYLGLLMGADPEQTETPLSQGRGLPETLEKPLSPKVMEASLPAGWNQVVMRWHRGWLVARAPLPAKSLRGILRSVH